MYYVTGATLIRILHIYCPMPRLWRLQLWLNAIFNFKTLIRATKGDIMLYRLDLLVWTILLMQTTYVYKYWKKMDKSTPLIWCYQCVKSFLTPFYWERRPLIDFSEMQFKNVKTFCTFVINIVLKITKCEISWVNLISKTSKCFYN